MRKTKLSKPGISFLAMGTVGIALSFTLLSALARADVFENSGGADLSQAANWYDLTLGAPAANAPTATDIAQWDSLSAGGSFILNGTPPTTTSWLGIVVVNPTAAVTIGGTSDDTNTLDLGASGIDMSAATQNLTLNDLLVLTASQTWNVASGRTLTIVDFTGTGETGITTSLGGNTLTIAGAGNTVFGTTSTTSVATANNNSILGSGSIVKNGTGTLTISSAGNTISNTTVNNGTLSINMPGASTSTQGTAVSVPVGNVYTGGGTISVIGGPRLSGSNGSYAYVESIGTLNAVAGDTSFLESRGSSARTIVQSSSTQGTRAVGGTVNFTDAITSSTGANTSNNGGYRLPTGFNVNGVVPWISYTTTTAGNSPGGSLIPNNPVTQSWFVAAGTSGNGTAYAAYTNSNDTSLGTSAQNVDVVNGTSTNNANITGLGAVTVNTLRFNSGNSHQIIMGNSDSLTVGAGGILVTGSYANHKGTITGGTLEGGNPGSGSGNDLMIIDYADPNAGSNALFEIDSAIIDNTTNGNALGTATALTKSGTGTLVLTSANSSYTGNTYLNDGITKISAEGATTGSLGAVPGSAVANNITFTGGTLQLGAGINLNSNRGITLNDKGGTFDTNGFNSTYGGAIAGTGPFTKAGAGSLRLTGTSSMYSGNTIVSVGTLSAMNGSTGSATGTGKVTVNSGAFLAGTGTISGAVTVSSGGHLAPGDSGVGALTVGSLNLSAGSISDIEFASDSSYDQATISNSGGLSLFDTTGINLYSVGGTTPYVSLGNHVYNLFQYTGSIGGQGLDGTWTTASATNPHILNAQPNTTYSFALSGGYVTLDVNSVSSAVSSNWISTNSSATHNWSDTNNWNAGVPHNAGDSASFLSTPAGVVTTVNLDASETVGALSFNSASSYAITPTASQTLTLDTGVGTTSAAVTVSLGNHAINSNVTLNSNTVVTTTNPTDSMTFNGNIGGNGKFEADGPGTVILTGTNNYVGNTTIGTTATLQLGSTGTPTSGTLGGTNLTDNGTISFNRSNSYTFSGNITGTGKVVQAGSGITTLNGTSDGYQGGTQITGGTLKMGTATALGTGSVSITSPGTLDVNATSPTLPGVSGSGTVDNTNGSTTQIILNVSTGTSTFTGAINNTGGAVSIDKQGSGTQALNGSSGYTGNTTIDAGILSVNSATSLGNGGTLTINNGTLEVNTGYSTARTVVLGSGTTPTVQVDTSQIYTNTNPSGLTGDNLTKTGAGTMALSGPLTINNTLAINGGVLAVGGSVTLTNVPTFSNSSTLELEAATNTVPLTSPLAGGTLQIDAAASYTFSGAFALASSTTVGGIYVNGGTFTATAGTVTLTGVNNTGNGNGGVITIEPGSTTNFSNISTTNADGGLLQIDGGNNTIGNVNIARSAFTASDVTIPKYTRGVIINGGITTMTGLTLGSGNSSATFSMTNGSLAVNGPISVGTGASARAEFFQVTNGTLSSTSPMQLVSVNGDAANIYLYGGTVTLPGINIFSSTVTSGTALITIGNGTTAGALYIGSSGIQATYPTGSTGNASLVLAQGGGVLGATADWSSNIPVSLTDASGTTVIQAADSVGTAHNITLSGLVSGSVTLIKTGGGKLTLTGMDSLPGITIQAGSLGTGLVNQSFGTLTLPNSATTHLDMGIGGRGETVQFNASGGELGTSSTLQVDDWTPGADHLSFPSGLNADQLALINFTGFGTGAKFVSGSSGEIEPASGMPALTFLPGDVNDDKHLDAVDILAEEKALANLSLYATAAGNPYGIPLTTDELYAVLDQNGDGQINGADVQYLITHELEGGGGSNATVPEPSSLILLGLALPAMWAARRRR